MPEQFFPVHLKILHPAGTGLVPYDSPPVRDIIQGKRHGEMKTGCREYARSGREESHADRLPSVPDGSASGPACVLTLAALPSHGKDTGSLNSRT